MVSAHRPFFSICIPQFNRTPHLLEALESFRLQSFRDFEVCVSDGGSTDGGFEEIKNFLIHSGLDFNLENSKIQIPYDQNLRKAISLSSGKYLLLMGNDDKFSDNNVLHDLYTTIQNYEPVGVAVTNYLELSSGNLFTRSSKTINLGFGWNVAVKTFRNVSFVSGVILNGESARRFSSSEYDGSEMYQMYLSTRIIASGGNYLAINRSAILKDIQIQGIRVDSFRNKNEILERLGKPGFTLPIFRLFEVVVGALNDCKPSLSDSEQDIAKRQISRQLYLFTFPFWLIEYRRLWGFKAAFTLYLYFRPFLILSKAKYSSYHLFLIWVLYLLMGIIGLIVPIYLFDYLRPVLYRLAKK